MKLKTHAVCCALLYCIQFSGGLRADISVGTTTVIVPPKVAISDKNTSIVTWDGLAKIYDTSGATIKDVFVLDALYISMRSDGEFFSANSKDIQRFSADGTPMNEPYKFNTLTNSLQRIGKNTDISTNLYGESITTKSDTILAPFITFMYGQRFDIAGNTLGEEFLINEQQEDRGSPIASISANDGYVISWRTEQALIRHGVTGSGRIYASRYDAHGALIKKEFTLNSDTYDGYKLEHDVAIDGSGNFVSAWSNYIPEKPASLFSPATPPSKKIKARRFDWQGEPLGGEFLIHADNALLNASPQIAMNHDGHFIIVWESREIDGDNGDISARFYHSDGTSVGDVLTINDTLTGKQYSPDVAISTTGQIVVTWIDDPENGNPQSIKTKILQHPSGGLTPILKPRAHAGADDKVLEDSSYQLDASHSYSPFENITTYQWEQTSGIPVTLIAENTAKTSFLAPITDNMQGELLEFKLTITTNTGQTDSDTVVIYIEDSGPVADAGSDLRVNFHQEFTLNGLSSYDSDGQIISYEWSIKSGASVYLSNPYTSTQTLNNDSRSFADHNVAGDGSWVNITTTFTLTVTDDSGLISSDDVVVTYNMSPETKAGADRVVTEGQREGLDGSGSIDYDGEITSYQWVQTSGPTAEIFSATSAAAEFIVPDYNIDDANATLSFQLTTTDNEERNSGDNVIFRISPATNTAPTSSPQGGAGAVSMINMLLVLYLITSFVRRRSTQQPT